MPDTYSFRPDFHGKTSRAKILRSGGADLFLGFPSYKNHLLEKIEDAYDLEVYTAWLKSKRETVLFEDLIRECGFSEEEL